MSKSKTQSQTLVAVDAATFAQFQEFVAFRNAQAKAPKAAKPAQPRRPRATKATIAKAERTAHFLNTVHAIGVAKRTVGRVPLATEAQLAFVRAQGVALPAGTTYAVLTSANRLYAYATNGATRTQLGEALHPTTGQVALLRATFDAVLPPTPQAE
jgi:hypothetical protein